MGEGYNFQILKDNILNLSHTSDWKAAIKEWRLVDVVESEIPETCLCGHFPIIEICTIKNIVTGKYAEVGNVCVKRFIGIRSDLIFSSIKKVKSDISKSFNVKSIDFFHDMGVINDYEYKFSCDTFRKRNLSERQLDVRQKINTKILEKLKKRGIQEVTD